MKRVRARSGAELAVDDDGTGPAVIFMHGLAGFKELWGDALAELRGSGFRAVAYDHRGHGESGDVAPPWKIVDLADDLESVLDTLEIQRACVVGHSMGGRTMFTFALSRPERIWAIGAVGAQSERPSAQYRDALARLRDITAAGGVPAFRAEFERLDEIPARALRDHDYAQSFDRLFARNRAEALVAGLDAILVMPVLTPRLPEIRVPALVVVGALDRPFLELAHRYEQLIPDCRTVLVPDCYHYPMVDKPREFLGVLQTFLTRARPHH